MPIVVNQPAGYKRLLRSHVLRAALGWDENTFESVQEFIRRETRAHMRVVRSSVALNLDAFAVNDLCVKARVAFPALPSYEDDWHVKAILKRYLRNAARRRREGHGVTPAAGHEAKGPAATFALSHEETGAVAASSSSRNEAEGVFSAPAISASPTPPGSPTPAPPGLSSQLRAEDRIDGGDDPSNWRDVSIYWGKAHGYRIRVHPDTGKERTYISYHAAQRIGATMQCIPYLGWQENVDDVQFVRFDNGSDWTCLAKAYFTIDFDGMKEAIAAFVVDSTLCGVDLVLGSNWIRKHEGSMDWRRGRFVFRSSLGMHFLVLRDPEDDSFFDMLDYM
ncbi:hypothetical protein AURDEDRAFT_177531 [Auricularia subglabra TFB-10046 SS5]|uniref:Uncharacterized protein n=1 Tax=Auricularia subglabra (strain TFB-10046 / SS5) TaxID=717982 RepID=J0WNF9_AURST|nr:hypothetical protein AURDEDRAFT_177531 [Auricularia subglabra TFB-10046 SS5]